VFKLHKNVTFENEFCSLFRQFQYRGHGYFNKCTKHQFPHLLTATFKDLHIENSKNYKR